MTLAQAITELKGVPAQIEADLSKIQSEILAAETLAQPEVDLAMVLMPQVEAEVKSHIAALEAMVAAKIAELPPELAAILNKYLLPIEDGIQL